MVRIAGLGEGLTTSKFFTIADEMSRSRPGASRHQVIQKGVSFAENRLRAYCSAMPTEEEEMSLTKWRDLLGTELIIALEELAKNHKDGANKRHQHYVENCFEQYWTVIARITGTMGKRTADWIPFGLQSGIKPLVVQEFLAKQPE